jgi:hypothetical protein
MKTSRFLIALLAFSIAACGRGDTQPQVYQHLMDQFRARYPILGWPCEHREARDCYRFGPPRKMRGLWSTHFEESQFIDTADPVPKNSNEFTANKTWLEVISSRLPEQLNSGDYEIEFVGRKTTVPGRYGQMGESKHLVVVDRLISIRPVNLEQWITHWIGSSKTDTAIQTPR